MNNVSKKLVNKDFIGQKLQRVIYFFPLQLLLAHLKRNHILLVYWILLFAIVNQSIANKYGIPHLLLFPEYLGNVNFLSHVFLGAACGGFVMAFQISSYIMNGFRFPLIATLSNPFMKYQINNFIIPSLFYSFFVYRLIDFQLNIELLSTTQVLFNLLGFLAGNGFFIALSTIYFMSTNKSVFKLLPFSNQYDERPNSRPIGQLLHPNLKWYQFYKRTSEWKIETYITGKLRIGLARSSMHYDKEVLKRVFQQNHLNASIFEIGAFLSVFLLGLFMENPIFAIPAGASLFLLFTLILLFSGALHHWLRSWSLVGFISILVGISVIIDTDVIRRHNQAYGVNYEGEKMEYTNPEIARRLVDQKSIEKSYLNEIASLNAWKSKTGSRTMVIVNSSGGGLRSATWTFHCLQQADSLTNNHFFSSVRLICGASGGMIGSAYYRDLYLHNLLAEDERVVDGSNISNISKDILNPLGFAWVVNDMMIQYKYFSIDDKTYVKDRAYFFEKQLLENTNGMLGEKVSFYAPMVNGGLIPEIILTPTITNDGRRLLIGSRNAMFLYKGLDSLGIMQSGQLDFFKLFDNQDASDLKFSSALRMNATFPYVLPNVALPTEPLIEVMDAGVRDNYGYTTTRLYLESIKNWVDTALDKVIIVRIFDRPDVIRIKEDPDQSFIKGLMTPVGSVYTNMFNTQHMAGAQLFETLPEVVRGKVQYINLILDEKTGADIPLSWHISKKAEGEIIKGLKSSDNWASLSELKSALNQHSDN